VISNRLGLLGFRTGSAGLNGGFIRIAAHLFDAGAGGGQFPIGGISIGEGAIGLGTGLIAIATDLLDFGSQLAFAIG